MEKDFEDSFENVYNGIYEECSSRLKEVSTKNNRFVAVIVAILTIINLLLFIFDRTRTLIALTISLSVVITLLFIFIGRQNYKRLYKIYLINGLVKGYNKNFTYDQGKGVSSSEYAISKFDVKYDEFYSEDTIYGFLDTGDRFQTAEVVTQEVSKYRDANGNVKEEKTVIFRGIYGIVYLKNNINSQIYICNNSNTRKFSKNRVEVDSTEFEKYYDCLTNDKIKAMQIFTADLVEKYIEIVRDNKNGFELKIENNMMYFRYKCGNAFEPPTFKSGLDKEFVKKYYKLIYFPLEIMKSTIENINEIA